MPTTPVLAPVTGVIGEIRVADGSKVNAGDIIIVQHVTKTETNVSSPVAGQLKVLVEKGAQANQGDRIAEISA
ncbi:hypothetical protein JB92DRAFT_2923757 [Gautieria morchelliformis]|nr:hypothetical protein JB92DRAFT_2923757 [Gautieria morchelliformis]